MHRLYFDTEKYFQLIDQMKKLAIDGLEYAKMFSKETNRLKKLKGRNPELFENHNLDCEAGNNGEELKTSCKKINEYNNTQQ